MINFGKEFENYAVNHMGIGSGTVNAGIKYQINSSMTPYILEEREMRVTQMDIFSRLMRDRILWVSGGVDQRMSDLIQAQLLFLDSVEKKDITMYINSPGGSVLSGLSMIDVIDYINSDVATCNLGMCASMGAVMLAAGTKGKRSSLRFSRTMLHQSSGGAGGNIQDAEISYQEWQKYNTLLLNLLGEYTGKTGEQVKADTLRDKWFGAEEALAYGLIDEVIKTRKERDEAK